MANSAKNVTEGIMPIDDKMTVNERRKYPKAYDPRYHKARRADQSALLTEMETVTGMHRNWS